MVFKCFSVAFARRFFVSGIHTDDGYKIKGLESGAIDFIIKPINQSIFIAKVKVFIDLHLQRKRLYVLGQ